MPNAKNLCGDTYCEKQPVLNGNVHERQHKRTEKEEERIPSAPTNTNSTRTAQPQQVSFLNKKRQGPHRAFNSKHHRRSRGNRKQGTRQRGGPPYFPTPSEPTEHTNSVQHTEGEPPFTLNVATLFKCAHFYGVASASN